MTEHMFGKLKHLIDVARQKAREHHTSRVNNNKTNYGKTKALGRRYNMHLFYIELWFHLEFHANLLLAGE